jgi:hypothetical protein
MILSWNKGVLYVFFWLFFGFPSRARIVPRADDPSIPMLMQFALIRGRLYLQRFISPESENFFHNHRWRYMRSFVLSGQYVEERPGGHTIIRRRGRSHAMDWTTIHRIVEWTPYCVTLFYMSKEQRDEWGYLPAEDLRSPRFESWRTFVKKRIPNLESGNKEQST